MENLHGRGRLEEVAEEITLIFAPVERTFRKMLVCCERNVGISAPKCFVLRMLAEDDSMS